ncbi:MAG TPA: TetR/AcrR family transcriptional regulator [Candidatus Limnocylindrales bacterium]|jgi:AcrR family transcriptional regulator
MKTSPIDNLHAPPSQARALRADARRNIELLIAAAREAFAADGANAPLDDIAKAAGVGSGTLYRHFPTRLALVEAVYRDSVERLCAEGERLTAVEPPAEALLDWLRGFVTVVSEKRGLAAALSDEGRASTLFAECHGMINAAGSTLLDRAKDAGAIRADVPLGDILKMAKAFALAAETSPEGPALAERLLTLSMDGLRPRATSRS